MLVIISERSEFEGVTVNLCAKLQCQCLLTLPSPHLSLVELTTMPKVIWLDDYLWGLF